MRGSSERLYFFFLPARFEADDLAKALRVDDEQETAVDVAGPAEFRPRHVRFARKVAFVSSISPKPTAHTHTHKENQQPFSCFFVYTTYPDVLDFGCPLRTTSIHSSSRKRLLFLRTRTKKIVQSLLKFLCV